MIEQAEKKLMELSADQQLREMLLDRHRRKMAERIAMGAAHQKGRNEGLAEGKAEGLAEGKAKGERLLLEKLLTLKFGLLAQQVQQRLESADETTLTLWGERILTATTLDEMFVEK